MLPEEAHCTPTNHPLHVAFPNRKLTKKEMKENEMNREEEVGGTNKEKQQEATEERKKK